MVKLREKDKSAKCMRQNLFLASISRSRTCLNDVVRSNSAILRSFKGSRHRKYLFEERSGLSRETTAGAIGSRSRDLVFAVGCERLEEPIDLQ